MLVFLIAVKAVSVVFPDIWYYILIFGICTCGLFYNRESRKIVTFNHHKFRGQIHFMSGKYK